MLLCPTPGSVGGGGGGVYGVDILNFSPENVSECVSRRRKYYDIGYRLRNVLPYYLAFAVAQAASLCTWNGNVTTGRQPVVLILK